MIVILDLHYSHKDPAVLALMGALHMIPIYVPAGCTDLHQVCNRVVNKPYKVGVVNSFIDYVSEKFLIWSQRENKSPNNIFQLCMAGSVMKPLIPGYVVRGMAMIDTPDMKETIKTSFYIDTFLKEARLPETYAAAKLRYPVPTDEIPIPDEREAEENAGPVAEEEEGLDGVEVSATTAGIFDIEVGEANSIELREEEDNELQEDFEEVDKYVIEATPEVEVRAAHQPPLELRPNKPSSKAPKPTKAPKPAKTPKPAKRKRVVEDNAVEAIPVVSSRTGRIVQPSTVHGTIVANRYSTMNSCTITDTLLE